MRKVRSRATSIGGIINAVPNDPGLLRLSSRAFEMELTRAFCADVDAP
ncbi:hypothetical protein [Cupriavidus sp. H39]